MLHICLEVKNEIIINPYANAKSLNKKNDGLSSTKSFSLQEITSFFMLPCRCVEALIFVEVHFDTSGNAVDVAV